MFVYIKHQTSQRHYNNVYTNFSNFKHSGQFYQLQRQETTMELDCSLGSSLSAVISDDGLLENFHGSSTPAGSVMSNCFRVAGQGARALVY